MTRNTALLCADLILVSWPLVHRWKPSFNYSCWSLLPWWWLPSCKSTSSDAHVVCPEAISIKIIYIRLNSSNNRSFLVPSHFGWNEWKLQCPLAATVIFFCGCSNIFSLWFIPLCSLFSKGHIAGHERDLSWICVRIRWREGKGKPQEQPLVILCWGVSSAAAFQFLHFLV